MAYNKAEGARADTHATPGGRLGRSKERDRAGGSVERAAAAGVRVS